MESQLNSNRGQLGRHSLFSSPAHWSRRFPLWLWSWLAGDRHPACWRRCSSCSGCNSDLSLDRRPLFPSAGSTARHSLPRPTSSPTINQLTCKTRIPRPKMAALLIVYLVGTVVAAIAVVLINNYGIVDCSEVDSLESNPSCVARSSLTYNEHHRLSISCFLQRNHAGDY